MGEPEPSNSECCKPAPTSGGGCCPPKPAAGGGGCCAPTAAAARATPAVAAAPSSCCPPTAAPSCCPPKATTTPSCCPPKAAPSCCPPKASPSCCPPQKAATAAAPDATGALLPGDADAVRASVSEYYGTTLQNTADLKTAACCTKTPPPRRVRDILARVPEEIRSRYYGCGSPWPAGLEGRRVLDLGCGTGRDCFVAAALVGEAGAVIGVDMTEAQLEVGRRHAQEWARELGYAKGNVRFARGRIEDLPQCKEGGANGAAAAAAAAGGAAPTTQQNDDEEEQGVPASWADVIISNCVVNLSPDKPAVLRGAFDTLAPGGEMHFADVYCSRRLSRAARSDPIAVGECLGGALFTDDFLALCRDAGFARPRVAAAREFEVHDAELLEVLGKDARFFSVTFRVFKLGAEPAAWAAARKNGAGAEAGEEDDTAAVPDAAARGFAVGGCQDFGQTATYLGTVTDHPERFELDMTAAFEKGKAVAVCAATAAALGRSWLAPHFDVSPPSAHRGAFLPSPCGDAGCGSGAAAVQRLADAEEAAFAAKTGGGGGGSGGCC